MKKLLLTIALIAGFNVSAQDGFFHNEKRIYPEKFAQTKTGDAFLVGLTYGLAKATTKSYLAKPHARIKTKVSPEFKLIITPIFNTGIQSNQLWSIVQSPDEFALVKFRGDYKHKKFTKTVKNKKGKLKKKTYSKAIRENRWLKTGEFGLYSGVTTSPDPESFIDFEWDVIDDNEFIITTNISSAGEYGFIYIGNNTAYANQSVYTFSVEDNKGYKIIE